MSNSSLASYTKLSPFCNSPRNHEIDTVSIHCYVGQASVESMGDWLSDPRAKASSNYGIGSDGRVGIFVNENDRSHCTSSSQNDNRAITIECACEKEAPFEVNDAVYTSLIELLTDICKRNNIKELKWKGDKSLIGQVDKQNMTVHKWFKNKDCPGEYLYSRHGQIAREVNAKLGRKPAPPTKFPAVPFAVEVIVDDLNYRDKPSMDGEVQGQTGNGVFTITKVIDGWGYLKSEAGWIFLENPEYCIIQKTVAPVKPPVTKEYMVSVDIDNLNLRKGPGTDYSTNGLIPKGAYTIVDESRGKGSSKGWGKLKSGSGWVSLDFVKRI